MKTKGQALVEMAIVLLLLFMLVFGIFQFGWLMYIKNSLNNAARAGVRKAVVTPRSATTNTWTATEVDPIKTYTVDSVKYVTLATGNVNVCVNNDNCDTDNSTGSTPSNGDKITVKVTLPSITPIAPILSSVIPTSLYGRATMRYE